MGVPRPRPWGLGFLLFLLPTLRAADSHFSLLYHLTAVSSPAPGTPAFWVSGWLGPQQYLSYNNLRAQADPCGAWVWENQVSWYWEKETTDLRNKQELFLEGLRALGEGGPYTLQGLLGCELGPDNTSVPVAKFALNGEDFMNFDPKLGTWNGDWPETETIRKTWMQQAGAVSKERTFLLNSCPQRLLGHLERGRGNLEWKEPPSMRLKARPGSPGFSVLTCSAFSFYPPELQLRFLRNGLAAGSGEGDLGPNGDGSFHAWSSLTVRSGDEHHYRCLVQHAGLSQPLTVELESPAKSSVPVVGIVVSFLLLTAVAAGGALLWRRMRKGLPAPWMSLSGDDEGALLPTPGVPKDADS
ncbi:IgG receptor FcRn large subunit p51 isoform X1 [Neomonachus schauinslandi]|uniref:IgG receptor FcRn large subunit p51 n=1 Tax=Neomonachus schauinslandi TaxID=29088 RepID=A0A2Y9GHH9_NEOSC|nr:IgG receptor FcRn large subunit p51 isoform X1 [Neomonachus schauinslandi]XP_021536955.1 IgG receptor FcRn large subunit p51 isoform X1 [Neomonachus schauinslandi]XP_021536957.1 IgG receptor FcRn large subunit p51 isoform X1 [Neomonachus schauinslandi]